MDIEKYLSDDKDSELLFRFAYIGKSEEQGKYLKELAELAEPENWNSPNSEREYDILLSYITFTFDKAAKDNLILISDNEEYSAFNTGLLTVNGEDIIGLFNKFKSSKKFSWHITGFRKESDWEFLNNFSNTPTVVSYFINAEKIYFNPRLQLVKNLDHILDENNILRFDPSLQAKGKQYILALITHALDLTLKRCKRNYRIAVPQYYNGEITYLLPVNLDGFMMALAVGYVNNRYRVNTIFTIDMAYKNARLLMKPEADWLNINVK